MSGFYQLEFEKPVREVEARLAEAERAAERPGLEVPALGGVESPPPSSPADVDAIRAERDAMLKTVYSKLSPWDTVRVARHPGRPQTRDHLEFLARDFTELHGDRRFGDDPAIVTGFGRIGKHRCLIVGHQKGKSTEEKIKCHFGCAHPEGYRKALSKMKRAEKFGMPVVTLVDTPGAYPGIGAEERGQAEAIAVNLREMARLRTPVVSVVIGEGGSGGALGIAVADRVAMLEHAWYSVISPEGCAAILWKQANEQTNNAAAKALRMTARDNLELGIIEAVVPEPLGGAHRDPKATTLAMQEWIAAQLDELATLPAEELVSRRYDRFRRLGAHTELEPAPDPPAAESPSP